ncbi:hypothetical protein O1M54_47985 [Streptomyces diastatochromogenes]|nr:hypothetical protein [Streptomyces diastatochromogenes]
MAVRPPGRPAFGESLLAHAVSPRYVADALATRVAPYRHSLIPMIVHSVLGGLLMLLGPAQLLTATRRRSRPHRGLGILFAVTVYASMAGAGLYLARTAPRTPSAERPSGSSSPPSWSAPS